jgi:putative AdoMet-dependent methyltransferase
MIHSAPALLFNKWAQAYDPANQSGKDDFPFAGYDLVLDKVLHLAEVKPGMRVLDLGIGTGNLAARFLDAGCEVWGCDFSGEMLARAHASWPQMNLRQTDLLGEWPPELRQPFDRVVAAYVLHHFDLATKMNLLRRVAAHAIAVEGRILVADVAFPTAAVRSAAALRWAEMWDVNEHYMAADLQATYRQISSCAGIFSFTR